MGTHDVQRPLTDHAHGGSTMQTSRTRRHRLTAVAMAAAIGLCANGLAADASGGGHHLTVLGAMTPPAATSSLPTALPADGSCASVAGCDLYARAGAVDAGSTTGIPIWGFTTDPVGPGRLGGDLQNTIIISEGQTLTLNVHNCLQAGAGDLFVEVPAAQQPPSAVAAAADTCGASVQQKFSGLLPGSFVYEAGATAQQPRQLAMGLSAVIIVRPAGYDETNPALKTPYGTATSSPFDAEALVVMNEIDPAFNAAPLAGDVEDYKPQYFFINGKAYSDTPGAGTEEIAANAGDDVVLHVANLGIRDRAVGLLNLRMDVIGDDSHKIYAPHTPDVESKLLTPGQVADVHTLVDPAATLGTQFPVLDLSRHLNNGADVSVGGMLTFIDVVASGYTDPGAPVAKSVKLADATLADDGLGNFPVTVDYTIERTTTSAAWFLDDVGGPCTGDLAPDSGVGAHTNVTVTIPVGTAGCGPLWTNGDHVMWIQPSNSALLAPAGTASGDVFTLALVGPTISGLSTDPGFANLSLNRVDGSTDVILTGAATPSLLDYEIDSAQVCVGASPCFALDVAAPVVPSHTYALRTLAGIPVSALGATEGPVTLNVQATESPAGPGGAIRSSTSSVVVVLDHSVPTLTNITANPNPAGPGNTAGNLNFVDSVRIALTANDAFSPIADVELFVAGPAATDGPIPAEYGTGSQMRPRDGQWLDGTHDAGPPYARDAYAEIPETDLLVAPRDAAGAVHLFVHAKDAAGNWGTPVDFALPIDDTAPTITAASFNAGTRTITVTANDSAGLVRSGLAKFQYHLNLGPESAAGAEVCMIASCVTDIVINWADGSTHSVTYPDPGVAVTQVFVRVQDAAGNWSAYTTLP
jgi:hypothetical protein